MIVKITALPKAHQKVYYDAFCNTQPKKAMNQMRMMVAEIGVEKTFEKVYSAGMQDMPQEVLDAFYNTLLYMHTLSKSN